MDVVIVGLDGLEPSLVEQWEEDLPTLGRLADEGSLGLLESSDPPLSAPAWPWMFTGKQGGKHGCFGFTRRRHDSYERLPINYEDIHAESLWEALDAAGISCGVVNVPLTYPPSELEHGFVVAGWPVPNRVTVSNPPGLVDTIEAETGERYRVNPFPMGPELRDAPADRVFEHVKDGIWHHQRAFTAAANVEPVDVFFCVFMATDVAGHFLAWDQDWLRDVYVEQDRALGELLDAIDGDPEVIVLSDHGHAARADWNFHVNEWLRREGYLARSRASGKSRRRALLRRVGVTRENLLRAKNRLGIDDVRHLLPQFVFERAKRTIPPKDERNTGFDADLIDWDETEAYSADQNVIYLNTAADYPQGRVEPDELSTVTEKLASDLASISHPRRDESLFTDIKQREEVFEGPFADEAPAVVAIADGMRVPMLMSFNDGEVFSSARSGEHRPTGTLFTAGDSFVDADEVEDRSILDLFPLVLAMLDVPIPENADGSIPGDRLDVDLEPKFRENRDDHAEAREYSDAESEEIREQLKGLGYLE